MDEKSCCHESPKKIHAVRGPKTRKLLIEQGISCPEVYGDPALLLPFVYNPNIRKKYKIGIVPHYVDSNSIYLEKFKNNDDILIIDILGKDPFSFLDKLLSCEKIISSSLHGLIVSDAYKIPSLWVEFSNNVLGNGFKFYDYLESVNRPLSSPVQMNENSNLLELLKKFDEYEIKIDLNKLINSAPFSLNIDNK